MPNRPPILAPDYATGRVYIVTDYTHGPAGLVAHDRTDVTDAVLAIVKWWTETGGPRG